jgi:hypothetical protein
VLMARAGVASGSDIWRSACSLRMLEDAFVLGRQRHCNCSSFWAIDGLLGISVSEFGPCACPALTLVLCCCCRS